MPEPSLTSAVPERLMQLLRHLDEDVAPFLAELAPRMGLGPLVAGLVQSGSDRFQLVMDLGILLIEGTLEPREVHAVLSASGIHPLSVVMGIGMHPQSYTMGIDWGPTRRALLQELRLGLPAVWRELLDLGDGPDGPEPEGLLCPGSLRLQNHPCLDHLPRHLAVHDWLLLSTLPTLRTLPEDLWCGGGVELVNCENLKGWPRATMVDSAGEQSLRRSLGLTSLRAEPSMTLTVQCCPRFVHLPDRVEIGGNLEIVSCHAFQRLPLWPKLFSLELIDTMLGTKVLSGLRGAVIHLEELPDLEEIEAPMPSQWDASTLSLHLTALPKLKRLRNMEELRSLSLRECPFLVTVRPGSKLKEFDAWDLPAFQGIQGVFRGEYLSLRRCPSLRKPPRFGGGLKLVTLLDCPNLATLPMGSAEAVTARRSGPRPASEAFPPMLKAWDAAHDEGRLLAEPVKGPLNLAQLSARLDQAPTIFAKVRVLAHALYADTEPGLVLSALASLGIHPASLLFDLTTSFRFRRVASQFELSPELKGLEDTVCLGPWALHPYLLNLVNLKLPLSAGIEKLTLPIWPEGLEIEDDLWITEVKGLRALPDCLHVGGDLTLEDLPDLERLPREMHVEGNLTVYRVPRLRSMPSLLGVGGKVRWAP